MFAEINTFLNDLIWGNILIYLLPILGIFFTVSSRFVQFRYFFKMFHILRDTAHDKDGHISSFQALMLSVAGRVGGGNIAGVAVAITLGGAGVLWITDMMLHLGFHRSVQNLGGECFNQTFLTKNIFLRQPMKIDLV